MPIKVQSIPKFTIHLVQPKSTKRPVNIISVKGSAGSDSEGTGLDIDLFELGQDLNGALFIRPQKVIACGGNIAVLKQDPEDFLQNDEVILDDQQVAVIHSECDPDRTLDFVNRQFDLACDKRDYQPRIILFKPNTNDVSLVDSLMQATKYSRFIAQRFLEMASSEEVLAGKLSELLPSETSTEPEIVPLLKK